MAFDLPKPIAAFLKAAKDHDAAAVRATFADEALLTDLSRTYEGREIETWIDRRFLSAPIHVHPINVARRRDWIILTVMFQREHPALGIAGPLQLDWHFTLSGDRIATFVMIREPLPELPALVAAYVEATNRFDLDALLATFAEDALVNDQFRDYWGIAAIKQWAERDIIGDRVTMYVIKVIEHHGNVIVVANVDGDYDKRGLPEPLVLSFYFSSSMNKIVQLIILRNMSEP